MKAVAIDLDGVLGDTRSLWDDWIASACGLLGVDADRLPEDRARAAVELDRGDGNWRALLERFGEDRVAVYLRRDAAASDALRALSARGVAIGVFTDAPEPLARVALTHLGADRRVSALAAGPDALERVIADLGAEAVVIRTRRELLAAVEHTE